MSLRRNPRRHAGSLQTQEEGAEDLLECGTAPVSPWHGWLETALLAGVAVLVLRALAHGGDRLLLRGVPWLALAPLLAGLRYGSRRGAACGAFAAAALVMVSAAPGAVRVSATEIALGWVLAGLLPGAFRDLWSRRLRGAEAGAGELTLRLDGLARAYHALELSHDRLELETGTRSTLRAAFDAFRRELVESPAADGLQTVAGRILAFLRDVAFVRAATLHPVDGDGRPGLALAAIGPDGASCDDALVVEAARCGAVVSVRELPAGRGVLAAVPLVDVMGRVHAVVAVHDLPFLSLHAGTLALLAVLGGHVGDVLARLPLASHEEDGSVKRFCTILRRAMVDAREHAIPASLAIVALSGPPNELGLRRVLAGHVAATRRLTDDAEVLAGADGNPVVLVLLRLADGDGLRSHRQRLEQLAQERARELGSHGELRLTGWALEDAPLPRDPRELEASLAALLAARAAGPDEEAWEHGAVA